MPENSNKPETSSGKDRANHLKEWEKARDVLQFFDDKLHDLRKYGFTFVTALLTVEGILLRKASGLTMSDGAKVAVFGVTMLLILALYLVDQNYKFYQRAANTRALVLERKLNLELSEIITDRYKAKAINLRVLFLYFLFVVGVAVLGGVSLYPNWSYIAGLIGIAVIVILSTLLTFRLGTTFKYEEYKEDWTISPLECTPTDKVTITLTNLGEPVERRIPKWMQSILEKILKKIRKKNGMTGELGQIEPKESPSVWEMIPEPIRPKECPPVWEMTHEPIRRKEGYPVWEKVPEPIIIKKDDLVWEMINEESGEITLKTANSDIVIYDSHIWTLKRDDFGKSGTYRLRPRGWPVPLQRRIIVSDNTREKTEDKGKGEKTEKKGETAGD